MFLTRLDRCLFEIFSKRICELDLCSDLDEFTLGVVGISSNYSSLFGSKDLRFSAKLMIGPFIVNLFSLFFRYGNLLVALGIKDYVSTCYCSIYGDISLVVER